MPSACRIIDPRSFKSHDFVGNQASWCDWSFAFKRSVRSNNVRVFELVEHVEKLTMVVSEANLVASSSNRTKLRRCQQNSLISCVSLAQARPWRSSAASTLAGASWLGSDGTANTSPKPWPERFAS